MEIYRDVAVQLEVEHEKQASGLLHSYFRGTAKYGGRGRGYDIQNSTFLRQYLVVHMTQNV